jgi:hypothetical protein
MEGIGLDGRVRRHRASTAVKTKVPSVDVVEDEGCQVEVADGLREVVKASGRQWQNAKSA